MSGSLTAKPNRPARQSQEPLRPSDIGWRARNGQLRDDYGPYFPILNIAYGDGTPALQRQYDGSGCANYTSGRKAVCTTCHHKTRRVAAICYADREFPVRSNVPVVGDDDAAAAEEQKRSNRSRTRHLGAMDAWGIGSFESEPDAVGGRRKFEVTTMFVTVSASHIDETKNVRWKVITRADRGAPVAQLEKIASSLQVPLNQELLVSYNVATGITTIDFNSDGIKHTFHVGEVYRAPPSHSISPNVAVTHPAELFDGIQLKTQELDGRLNLDRSCGVLVSRQDIPAGVAHEKTRSGWNTWANRTIPGRKEKDQKHSETALQATQSLSRSFSNPATLLLNGTKSLETTAKTLCDGSHAIIINPSGKVAYEFDHLVKRKVRESNPDLERPQIPKHLAGGFTYPKQPIPKAMTFDTNCIQPKSLQVVTAKQIGELAASLDSKGAMLIVLVVADWATKSSFNSCMHARAICEAAYGELIADKQGDRVQFAVCDMTEAGAVHSTTKWVNPMTKPQDQGGYGVREAPWMLMFDRGRLVYSEKPVNDGTSAAATIPKRELPEVPRHLQLGGLGFATPLRNQPVFAKPRVLVLEPVPADPAQAGNNFKLQLETQEVLKQAGLEFDLALSVVDGRRMAAIAEPPYGILLASSQVGASAFVDIATRLRQRSEGAVSFVCHEAKVGGELRELPPEFSALRDKGDLLRGVFQRPLSKSSFEKALWPIQSVKTKYPKCGMTKEALVELIRRKMSG